jgi:hypothetical protein
MIILFSGVCWILIWILVLGRAAAVSDNDALVKLFAKACPHSAPLHSSCSTLPSPGAAECSESYCGCITQRSLRCSHSCRLLNA